VTCCEESYLIGLNQLIRPRFPTLWICLLDHSIQRIRPCRRILPRKVDELNTTQIASSEKKSSSPVPFFLIGSQPPHPPTAACCLGRMSRTEICCVQSNGIPDAASALVVNGDWCPCSQYSPFQQQLSSYFLKAVVANDRFEMTNGEPTLNRTSRLKALDRR
jgi:hypothetical protein